MKASEALEGVMKLLLNVKSVYIVIAVTVHIVQPMTVCLAPSSKTLESPSSCTVPSSRTLKKKDTVTQNTSESQW